MSFRVDLWNGFDIIKDSIYLNRKKVKQFIEFLSSYLSIQKDYYKNLETLCIEANESKDLPKSNSLLENSIQLLITSFKKESNSIKEHYCYLSKYLNEFRKRIEKVKSDTSTYFAENNQNKELFNKVLNNLITKQETYNKSCNDLCSCLAEMEANKIIEEKNNREIYDNNNKSNLLNKNILKEFQSKKESIIEKLLEHKNKYIKFISEADSEREKYNQITEELLNKLEGNYKEIIFIFTKVVNTYLNDKIKAYRNIIEENDKNESNLSLIDCKKENLDFIIKNATKEFPMNSFEFIQYKINKNKINQKLSKYTELTQEDINKINEIIKNKINFSKINIYENIFLRQSFIYERTKKVGKVNKMRKSGSSKDIFSFKKDGNNYDILNNNNDNDNIYALLNKNNNFLIKNKDDSELINLSNKKANFRFIKDFVLKLFKSQSKCKENNELYSDESCEEKEEKDKNKKEDNMNKDRFILNESLFNFLEVIDLSNKGNNENLDYFIKLLTFLRSKNSYLINENAYEIFVFIFGYILINYKSLNNVIKNVILFSQTFYKTDKNSNKKIYILNGLKDHNGLNNTEIWHRAINYNLSLSLKNNNNYNLNIINKEEYLNNLNKIVTTYIIYYLYDIKLSISKKEVYEEVRDFYVKIYNLDGKLIEKQVSDLFKQVKD